MNYPVIWPDSDLISGYPTEYLQLAEHRIAKK